VFGLALRPVPERRVKARPIVYQLDSRGNIVDGLACLVGYTISVGSFVP